MKDDLIKGSFNDELLKEITDRIVRKIKPDKIVLFGSYAYGKPNKDNDLDLFIIKNTKLSTSKRYAMVSGAVPRRLIAMDFVVRTPKEISRRLKGFDPFLEEVINKGRVLYEKKRPY